VNSQPLQINAAVITNNWLQPFPSISFPINHLRKSCLLNKSSLCNWGRALRTLDMPCHSSGGYSCWLPETCGGKVTLGMFSLSATISPANSHPTNCYILIYHESLYSKSEHQVDSVSPHTANSESIAYLPRSRVNYC
jgi:hypothetical protein